MEHEEIHEADFEVVGAGTAVARRPGATVAGLIRPVAKPAEVLQAQEETRALVEQALKHGRDFDTIPGTKRPTLLKPGAERVNAAFGCAPRFDILEQEVEHDREVEYTKTPWEWHPTIRGKKVFSDPVTSTSVGLYRYVVRCELVHRESGVVIGQGVGSCSTLESKYIDRPRDCENTVLKMAKKRAFIDATLTTFGLSDQFTQDVEDMDLGHDSGPFSLDDVVGFGKHKDRTWSQVLDEAPDYVDWAVQNMERLTAEAKRVLSEALAEKLSPKESFRDEWNRESLQANVTGDEIGAFARLHPRVGDDPARWEEADYGEALRILRKYGREKFTRAYLVEVEKKLGGDAPEESDPAEVAAD